jgi:DNA polymerase I-like protein with 3'-5' exonuclease and polymerase domains
MREKPLPFNGGHYLATFDPGITQTDPSQQQIIDWDVRLAHRLLTTGTIKPKIGNYRYVASYAPLIARIEHAFAETGEAQDVSFDLETMGFWPWYPDREIVTAQFTFERGTAEVMYVGSHQVPPVRFDLSKAEDRWHELHWLLTSPKVKLRGANAKFDLIWAAEKWGIECTNLAFDTLLVGSLMDENRSNSLNLHAKLFTTFGGYDDEFNKLYDKGHMERIPTNKLLPYAGGDTDATQDTADVLREQILDDPETARFYMTIVHPASRAFERIERRGVCLDAEVYKKLGNDLAIEIQNLTVAAMKQVGGRLLNKHNTKIERQIDADKNPLVPSILKDYFFSPQGLNLTPKVKTPKNNEPTMAMSHLKMFDHPDAVAMVKLLEALNGATKTKSTFCDGFLNHLRPDGRLHPSYMLFHGAFNDEASDESGTVTGRLAAKDPAIQTLPKKTKWAKRLREAFIAPLGKCVLNLDFSQGELRVVACLAPEPTMLASYEAGYDLHAVTGAKLGGYDLERFLAFNGSVDPGEQAIYDKLRSNAKPMNFGLLYGMSVDGFQRYAWALYGKMFSKSECEVMHEAFFDLYAGLPDYHAAMKELVHTSAMVRGPLGRVRHLPHINSWDREVRSNAERQGINAPVQSTLTDMMIWALALIEKEYGDNPDLEVVAMIHDALMAYVPIEDAQLWAKRLTTIMSNLPFHELDWAPQLAFPADAEAGPNLASLSKVKLAA